MLQKLNQIDKAAKTSLGTSSTQQSPKHFNASLPVLLKVLAKTQGNNYLLKLGNTTITTQSNIPLQIGKTYWANMQQNQAGQIILNRLIAQPSFEEHLKYMPLKLTFGDLAHLAKDPKAFVNELKEFLLTHLSTLSHKEDFKELSMLAISLTQGVLSLVITDEDKDHLIQIAPKKQREALDFYAIFPRLGPIQGSIFNDKATVPDKTSQEVCLCADLWVMNEQVQTLLEANSKTLGFERIRIFSDTIPKELFSFADSLLDIKG